MTDQEIKALVSLLDDDDNQVISHVEDRIKTLGSKAIPFLEQEWENNLNPDVQYRIEELIHRLQYDTLKNRLEQWASTEHPDLLTGMWLVASYQYPDLELDKLKKDLEQIYYEAWLEFKPDVHPYDQVKILNSVIFHKLRFSANIKNFHSPGNSMINIVLESRRGNPISLCVIYMLIAQKLKLPIYGVNLPNLFILTFEPKNHTQFYINAFNRGLIFTKEDIDHYLGELHLNPKDSYYQRCDNMDIIRRVLRNLIVAFEKMGEYLKSDEVKTLLQAISDGSGVE